MAFTVTDQLSSSNASGATLTLSPAANIAVGSLVVVLTTENNTTGAGTSGTLADSAGNTYTAANVSRPGGGQGTTTLWYCLKTTVALTTAGTWTYTKHQSGISVVMSAISATYSGNLTLNLNEAPATGTTGSPDLAGNVTIGDLVVGGAGIRPRATGATFTPAAGWTIGPDAVSPSNGSIGQGGSFIIAPSTGSITFDPTTTSANWCGLLVSFTAFPPVALSGTIRMMVKGVAAPLVKAPLSGRGTAMARARAAPTAMAGLAGVIAGQARGRATAPVGAVPMSGRLTGQTKASALPRGSAGLRGALTAMVKASAAPRGVVPLVGRLTTQFVSTPVLLTVGLFAQLTGRMTAHFKVRSVPSGTVSLSGALTAQAKGATPAPARLILLVGRITSQAKASAVATGQAALSARATMMGAGRGTVVGAAALAGRFMAAAKSSGALVATMPLSGRMTAMAKGAAPLKAMAALTGRLRGQLQGESQVSGGSLIVNLSGRLTAKAMGRGPLAASANLVGLIGIIKSMFTGRGQLSAHGKVVTQNGCIIYGRAAKGNFTGRAARATFYGKACEC